MHILRAVASEEPDFAGTCPNCEASVAYEDWIALADAPGMRGVRAAARLAQ
jgi:hypothetical protein